MITREVAVTTTPAGRYRYCYHRLSPAVTYVPVTQRNFKLSSFSVMAASSRSLPVSNHNKWYHSRQQIDNNPSRRAGLDPDKELSYRQQAANLLQDMGQRLNVYLLSAAVIGTVWLATLAAVSRWDRLKPREASAATLLVEPLAVCACSVRFVFLWKFSLVYFLRWLSAKRRNTLTCSCALTSWAC